MKSIAAVVVVVAVLALSVPSAVFGDVYMHNPRGSNDRNCERNVNRRNGNRLFDSQNNAKVQPLPHSPQQHTKQTVAPPQLTQHKVIHSPRC